MPNFGFIQKIMVYEKNNMGIGKKTENENNDNK